MLGTIRFVFEVLDKTQHFASPAVRWLVDMNFLHYAILMFVLCAIVLIVVSVLATLLMPTTVHTVMPTTVRTIRPTATFATSTSLSTHQ